MRLIRLFSALLGRSTEEDAPAFSALLEHGEDPQHASEITAGLEPSAASESTKRVEPAEQKETPIVPWADVEDDLESALHDAFARQATEKPGAGGDLQDAQANREMFSGIACNQTRSLKSFIIELKRGLASRDWVEICRPVLNSVAEAAHAIGLAEAERMSQLEQLLAEAEAAESHLLPDELGQRILRLFGQLADDLPGVFALDDKGQRRESVMLHALLRQLPGVGQVTFERLYGAGLTTVDMLYAASAKDLQATTGLDRDLCDKICAKVLSHYERYGEEPSADEDGWTKHRQYVASLVAELRKQTEECDALAEADETHPAMPAKRRAARSRRMICMNQIEVALAVLGELDRIDNLRRLTFGTRVENLEQYLTRLQPPALTVAGR